MRNVNLLINSIRGDGLLCRTGALVLAKQWLGKEDEIAARYNLEPINYVDWKINTLEKDQKRITFSWASVIVDLNLISELPAKTETLLICNIDIALSSLGSSDVQGVWRSLREGFPHRPKGLILTLPNPTTQFTV